MTTIEAPRSAPPADIPPLDRRSLNLPNLITSSRFILSIVLFVLMYQDGWWRLSAAVFVIAAFTDFLDGFLARKYGQVTMLGRILDPFVDKIIICGAFIFLVAKKDSGVGPWSAFAIVARELFITTLRAVLEQRGKDFSAKWSGKIKMILQCAAVPVCLLLLSPDVRAWIGPDSLPSWLILRKVLVWGTVAVTVYSGIEYTVRAFRMLNKP